MAWHQLQRYAFMVDSKPLAKMLEDGIRADIISQLRETETAIGELKHNKDLLVSTLAEMLQKFDAKRGELESLERAAVKTKNNRILRPEMLKVCLAHNSPRP